MSSFVLSNSNEWELVHDQQDIRGWPVRDAADREVGRVARLIADTETKRVERIVLEDGQVYSARKVELGDEVVHLHGVQAPAAMRSAYLAHFDASYAATGEPFERYEPAYHFGHSYGTRPVYQGRTYTDVEPELRREYEREHGEGSFERVREATRHGFGLSRS